jgi:hypothetical protein
MQQHKMDPCHAETIQAASNCFDKRPSGNIRYIFRDWSNPRGSEVEPGCPWDRYPIFRKPAAVFNPVLENVR